MMFHSGIHIYQKIGKTIDGNRGFGLFLFVKHSWGKLGKKRQKNMI